MLNSTPRPQRPRLGNRVGKLILQVAFQSLLAAPLFSQGVDISTLGYNQGAADAPLRIVEFGDFGCEHCGDFHREVFPILKAEYVDTGKVTWKYIAIVLNDSDTSELAAIAGECAADQGMFFGMREALFEQQTTWIDQQDPSAALVAVAASQGLNSDRFGQCMIVLRGQQTIENNTTIATDMGVRTTPTFVILGKEMHSLPGSLPVELFREVLDEALRQLGAGER